MIVLMRRIVLLALVLLIGMGETLCAQNSLGSLRQSVEGAPRPHRLPRTHERRHPEEEDEWQDDEDSDDSVDLSGWGNPLGHILLLPFSGPRYLLDDHDQEVYFTSYPFADQHSGNLLIEPLWTPELKETRLSLGTEYGADFGPQQKVTTRLQFDTRSRFGLDASFDYLREQDAQGDHDQTWLGDINLTWRFAQSANSEFRTGIGYNWQADSNSSGKGFNFTYGGSIYLDKPSVIEFDLDLGVIGEANLTRFKTSYSRYLKRARLSVGYENLQLGSFEADYLTVGMTIDY
jgi:hypothetical protein